MQQRMYRPATARKQRVSDGNDDDDEGIAGAASDSSRNGLSQARSQRTAPQPTTTVGLLDVRASTVNGTRTRARGFSRTVVLLDLLLTVFVPAVVEVPRRSVDVPAPRCPDGATQNALVAHLSGPGCRIVPVFRRSHFVGLRLLGLRPGTPLVGAGFEKGDVLVAADGVALVTPAALSALFSTPGPATVTVERRGVRHELRPGCIARVPEPDQQR
jgi:hypothetical protein